jgi:hypothetical protein
MKAKSITMLFVTAILSMIWCSAAWAFRSNSRDYRQAQRVRQGIRSHEITRPEVLRLRNEQRRIHRAYQRASADGHISRIEHNYLNKLQNQASHHIYQAKHNYARRNHHRYYRKSAYLGIYHGHVASRHRTVSCYTPRARVGTAFSLGVGNRGWQFAFAGRGIR